MKSCVFVDSEISAKKQILDLGAIKDNGSEFHRNNPNEFQSFVAGSEFVVGHNISHHDLKYIGKYLPKQCEIVDTLYLSPLLFPSRPYHNLVKDDKISSEDVNNPLSDAIKCRDLFYDEQARFNALPEKMKDIYGELLSLAPEFHGFFRSVGWKHRFFVNVKSLIRECFKDQICIHADLDSLIKERPVELAYALALISASDKKSITPRWVLRNYPEVQTTIRELRQKNCQDEHCAHCSGTFNAKAKLYEFFGYKDFRKFEGENLQEQAVKLALDGQSLLAVFPTGGGKSLTFQLPALIQGEATRGLTVVISPLQSLMKDQVDNLEKKNITGAVTINGLLSPIERAASIEQVQNGNASLLYIAPESLRSRTIESLLLSREISRIVIDEAHCFSSWGQDFRVDYLFIADFIKNLETKKGLKGSIPISCFTATAKPKVVSDICAYFRSRLGVELSVLATTATRTNLKYKVLYQEDQNEKYLTLRELLQAKPWPTIVYVSRVHDTFSLADRLSKDGIPALPFNGQMERAEKVKNQNLFMSNDVQVIVATTAFGMGVDKSDVKLVIHYDISDSLENYVQEAGRAGRDESIEAECYILYNEADLDKHFLLLNQTKITINEIQQVWEAIKKMTSKQRNTVSASGLEIARRAGWDENVQDVETRVRSALSALEQAGYVQRKMNSPRVFATGVLTKNFIDAAKKINDSPLFIDDSEKEKAKRIIKSIISSKATSQLDDDAESRVDYIADNLGIPRMDVEEAITKMRREKILADSKDLNAYIKKSAETKTVNTVIRFSKLERFVLENIFKTEGPVDLKDLNDKAIKDGIRDATVKNIRTILFYWSLKEFIKCKRDGNCVVIERKESIDDIKKKVEKKLNLADRSANYLFSLATKPGSEEELIEFSLVSLVDALKEEISLFDSDSEFDEKDVEDALLYLSKIGAITLEGGFIVLYNSLNVERLISNNAIRYKQDDYKELFNYYNMKTQQIHMVGEFANMMLENYEDALGYVKDYFDLDYEVFVRKYFKGKERTGEIQRNITPEKYNRLFGDLSDVQKSIIDDDTSKYISVLAGPGSGKTRVLVHKLASLLLLEDIKSEQLLMLTFSRLAAREFRSRLMQLVGSAVNYVDIKTFHSYCFDLLGKVGNEEEFSDVVPTATELIRSGEVEEDKISKAVLVIDEAQDMDQDEYDLVKTLIEKNPDMRVIAVGDDDQNIFQFRGSDSRYLGAFVQDFENATKYEMVENYRSKKLVVEMSNRLARSIKTRIKTKDVVSVSDEEGYIVVTEHLAENLEIPVCKDFFKRILNGTTAILTQTNESALKVVGILVGRGIDAKLIQSDENIDLYNLAEFRFFSKLISKGESPVVEEEEWNKAKAILKNRYGQSAIFPKVQMVIEAFEGESHVKYRNDFISFLHESAFSDFESFTGNQVVVSTIHKAKGREFENVFLLLDGSHLSGDEEKRKVYVGMTRAKTNLFIHVRKPIFRKIADRLKLEYILDREMYPEPTTMEIQLSYHDVNLGSFKNRKEKILALKSGDSLAEVGRGLKANGERLLSYSQTFYERTLQPIMDKGYRIQKAETRYILAWRDKDHPNEEERAILLPNLYLRRLNAEELASESQMPENQIPVQYVYAEPENVPDLPKGKKKKEPSPFAYNSSLDLSAEETKTIKNTALFKALRGYRLQVATDLGVPPYVVFYDRTIIDIVIKKPSNKEELIQCHGFGETKFSRYGAQVLALVDKYG